MGDAGRQLVAVEGLVAGPVVKMVDRQLVAQRQERLVGQRRVVSGFGGDLKNGALNILGGGAEQVRVVRKSAPHTEHQALALLLRGHGRINRLRRDGRPEHSACKDYTEKIHGRSMGRKAKIVRGR